MLLSEFGLGSPSDVVQNGGRRGHKLADVLWECMLKFYYVRSCGGVCPLFLMPNAAYAHCFTYDLWECVFIELRPALSVVWRLQP